MGESVPVGMIVVGVCLTTYVGEGVGVRLGVGECGSTDVNANECLSGEDCTKDASLDECSPCGGVVGVSGAGVCTGGLSIV